MVGSRCLVVRSSCLLVRSRSLEVGSGDWWIDSSIRWLGFVMWHLDLGVNWSGPGNSGWVQVFAGRVQVSGSQRQVFGG